MTMTITNNDNAEEQNERKVGPRFLRSAWKQHGNERYWGDLELHRTCAGPCRIGCRTFCRGKSVWGWHLPLCRLPGELSRTLEVAEGPNGVSRKLSQASSTAVVVCVLCCSYPIKQQQTAAAATRTNNVYTTNPTRANPKYTHLFPKWGQFWLRSIWLLTSRKVSFWSGAAASP